MQPDLSLTSSHAQPATSSLADDDEFEPGSGIIDSVIKPLIAIDAKGNILDITPVAAMLLKGQVNKLKGTSIATIFPELAEDVEQVALPGFATQAVRADGTQMPVRLTAMRVATDYLKGWMIFLQVRKAPSLQEGLSHFSGDLPTPFNLP